MGEIRVKKTNRFWGEFRAPSDKSLTHRAYIIGAICEGGANIITPLRGQDCENTLNILQAIGVKIKKHDISVTIEPSQLHASNKPLWCGNSGTTMRLMAGLLCGLKIPATLVGDESLSRRPMKRIIDPLTQMGANISGDTPPLKIKPADLHGIDYESPLASAQVKTAIMLAGLFANGTTSITEPMKTRDHTERMLASVGCGVKVSGLKVTLEPGMPKQLNMKVPGDISSSAFFMIAASLLGGPLTIRECGINPTRTGILDVLTSVGVEYELENIRDECGEPVADIYFGMNKNNLHPFKISGPLVPRLIDEIPALAVLATQCNGESVVKDAQELRVKESDRIEKIAHGLREMGAQIEATEDGFRIFGPTPLKSAIIDSKGDHRIGMAFAIAGLIADGETIIKNADSIQTSFPNFEQELIRLSHV